MSISKLSALREQRDIKAREANALNDKYPADKRMEAADATKLDAILVEVEGIDGDIARELRVAQLAASALTPEQQHQAALDAATKDPAMHGKPGPEGQALRGFLAGGLSALTPEQRSVMQARVTPDIRAAMSTTTSTEGGYTTALEYQRSLEAAQKAYGGILAVCDTFMTATGVQMQFPTADATAEIGEIVGQNGPVTAADTTFGLITLDVYKYSSKKIALPFELLQDSFIDIEAYITALLAMRLGRITATHYTTGDGSGKPRGIVTATSVGKTGTTGQTGTVIYDDLVDLEHSVDPSYRGNAGVGYMMHDSSLKVVRKIKDSQGRPIFVPGYEQGNPGGAPDRLLNRPIYISQEMATMAANAKSILFGDYKKYKRRKVLDLTLFRMTDSAFTLNGQVGFVAFQREGGNLVDVGGATKAYQNAAS